MVIVLELYSGIEANASQDQIVQETQQIYA